MAITFAGARLRKSTSVAIARRGHGHRPKKGARSWMVVSLISTRTMSRFTAGGVDTAARIRQSYVFDSRGVSQPDASRPRMISAAPIPNTRPAISFRSVMRGRDFRSKRSAAWRGPRLYGVANYSTEVSEGTETAGTSRHGGTGA